MIPTLLNLPQETLLNILSFLPVRSLLRFAQTCHSSYSMATSSLHSLSLGIYTTERSRIGHSLSGTHFPEPKSIPSAFWSGTNPKYSALLRRRGLQTDTIDPLFTVPILIPEPVNCELNILFAFHDALIKSILTRYAASLRTLDISLWCLTVPTARGLALLQTLQELSIHIEGSPQASPRSVVPHQSEQEAWDILSKTAVWAPGMRALRIQNAEFSDVQLSHLLRGNRSCKELWICRCRFVYNDFWRFIRDEWDYGRAELRILGVMSYGGEIDEDVLDVIGSLSDLQVSANK